MNLLDRALIEKVGHEHGWENVLESGSDRVVLASARHRGRVSITALDTNSGWYVGLPQGRLTREVDRTQPGFLQSDGRFRVEDMDAMAALLRRAAELFQSLPDQAAQTFRERAAAQIAAIVSRGTEVERLVRQRVGQDVFREALLDYWGGACAVTGLALPAVLRASHAKPWASCESDEERLNVFNGFLLVANLDALFDRGLITFDEAGIMMISSQLNAEQRAHLQISTPLKLRWLADEHRPYLAWHRTTEFSH